MLVPLAHDHRALAGSETSLPVCSFQSAVTSPHSHNITSPFPPRCYLLTQKLCSCPSKRQHASQPATVTTSSSILLAMSAIDQNALRGMKPNRIIPVPPEFRRSCRASERDLIINDIHVNTGCRVLAQWDQSIIYQFEIFGTGAGLEKAIRYINQWISNAHTKSKESTAWAKTPAFDANAWYYEQVEGLELQRKQVFKGPAPEVAEGGTALSKVSDSVFFHVML